MKTIKHFLLFLIILGAIASGCSQQDDEPEEKPDDNVSNIDKTFTYDPNILNWSLAINCALYSALAYDETRIMKYSSYPNKPSFTEFNELLSNYEPENIQYFTGERNDDYKKSIIVNGEITPVVLHAQLNYEGFEKIKSENYGNDSEHDISYTLAYKEVNEDEILLVVILRGTDGVEWLGNMDVWQNENTSTVRHYSFQNANLWLQKDINEKYIKDDSKLKNRKINLLITGHSRGAAVANLLAVDSNTKKWCDGNIKNVYAYTFATPNNTTDFSTYSNIFNFCFDDDFVPQVPLERWGYGKSGKNHRVCAEDLYNISNRFKYLEDRYIQLSKDRNPSFDYSATKTVISKFYKIASSANEYYKTDPLLDMKGLDIPNNITLYRYMRNYVAQAAVTPLSISSSALYFQSVDVSSAVYQIANFFLDGIKIAPYVNDTHQALTYYYALISDGEKFSQVGANNEDDNNEDENNNGGITATTDPGVTINGVTWATRNVGEPGTFAENVTDVGMLYQWNRRTGWSATQPLTSSPAGLIWENSHSNDTYWMRINDPCPTGWHIPTKAQVETSIGATSPSIAMNNDINGFKGTLIGNETVSVWFRVGPLESRISERQVDTYHREGIYAVADRSGKGLPQCLWISPAWGPSDVVAVVGAYQNMPLALPIRCVRN